MPSHLWAVRVILAVILALLVGVCVVTSGCEFGLSAAASIPSVTAYCEPVNVDEQICREDDGATWLCVTQAGAWSCQMTAPHGSYWHHWREWQAPAWRWHDRGRRW